MRFATLLTVLFLTVSPMNADDRDFADALKKAGNNVKLDKDNRLIDITFGKSELLTDADYQQLGTLAHLKKLTFYGNCTMTDAQAEQIGKIATIEEMAINGTALSDAGFVQFGKLKQLKRLTFWHLGWQKVEITGKGFEALAGCPHLEAFGFGGSTIGDKGLQALAAVKSLKELSAGHTRITEAGLEYLKALPNLTTISVGPQHSMRLADAGLVVLAEIPTLESIEYNETILTYVGGLSQLRNLKGLKHLKFDMVEIAADDLAKLKADLPNVTLVHTPPDAKMLDQMRKIIAEKK